MKIENLNRVDNFRIFQRWRAPQRFGGFSDLNIIYADNGSGKSTFANLLNPNLCKEAWESGVEFTIRDPGSANVRIVSDPSDPLWDQVAVFNKDYAKAAIDFDNATATSLVALGKESVDRQKNLSKLATEFSELEERRPVLQERVRAASKIAPGLATNTAGAIFKDLAGVAGFDRGYNAEKIRRTLGSALSADERAALIPGDLLVAAKELPRKKI